MTPVAEQIPAGYSRHFRASPLTDPWEPLYSKAENGAILLALRIRQAHCNSRGFAHGGLISALADNAMGLSLDETLRRTQGKEPGALVTLAWRSTFSARPRSANGSKSRRGFCVPAAASASSIAWFAPTISRSRAAMPRSASSAPAMIDVAYLVRATLAVRARA
jgi:acyl-coenzyme A thioesterase PaaI-like protein